MVGRGAADLCAVLVALLSNRMNGLTSNTLLPLVGHRLPRPTGGNNAADAIGAGDEYCEAAGFCRAPDLQQSFGGLQSSPTLAFVIGARQIFDQHIPIRAFSIGLCQRRRCERRSAKHHGCGESTFKHDRVHPLPGVRHVRAVPPGSSLRHNMYMGHAATISRRMTTNSCYFGRATSTLR